ncbi:MAG: extracellular solute-binding protein [Eubacterium sp.]|nr:extracellular solute-binding protein [Eubacterium sp.]
MKKRLLKRVTGVALASAMMLSLAGCGGAKEESSSEQAGDNTEAVADVTTEAEKEAVDETASDETASEGAAGIDGWTPFDENVKIQVAVYDRGTEGIDSVTENGYTKYVQENFGDAYNITVEYVPITRSDVMTDYALLAASDSLPTILMEYDYPKVVQWANDGYLQKINLDDFAQVAPTYYNRMVELDQLPYTVVNGESYFCLAERPYYNTNYTYPTFVRMDWLKEVGYDHVPESYEEYIDAMKKIQEKGICEHPIPGGDGLGAMISVSSTCDTAGWIFRDYPISDTDWAKYSSLSCPALPFSATKKMLKRYNAEYNAGLWNPEYNITDNDTAKANFINGKQFSYAGYMTASVDWLESFYMTNPDAELAIASNSYMLEPGVCDQINLRSDNPYGMTIGFGNSATEDQLKAAWMYMEWSTLNIKELQSHADDWNNFNNSKDFWCVTIESVKNDTIEESIASIAPQNLPQDFTDQMIEYYNELKKVADSGITYTDPAFSVAIEAESEYSESLLSLYVVDFDKLVTCDPAEFDSLYDQLSKEYLDAGYQEVIDEREAAYKAGNSTLFPLD